MTLTAKEKYELGIKGTPNGGEGMKCPVISHPFAPTPHEMKWVAIECLKDECAWWNKADGLCAITEIAAALTTMVLMGGKLK